MITKGYGFSVHDIDWSCPSDMQPYHDVYRMEEKIKDEQNWILGRYIMSAFETVMASFGAGLSGKKSEVEYIEKPFLSMDIEKEETQEDIDKELRRMVLAEDSWIKQLRKNGLPETQI